MLKASKSERMIMMTMTPVAAAIATTTKVVTTTTTTHQTYHVLKPQDSCNNADTYHRNMVSGM